MADVQPLRLPVRVIAELPTVWRHSCGTLNEGVWQEEAVCNCGMTAKPNSVEGRYLLVELG